MLNQSIWSGVWTFVWLLIVIWLAITFSSDFLAWLLANFMEPKAYAAILVLASILYFTNPALAQLVQRSFQSASSASAITAGGRVENAFFLGRAPSTIPDAAARLPLTDRDRPLATEIDWVSSRSQFADAKK